MRLHLHQKFIFKSNRASMHEVLKQVLTPVHTNGALCANSNMKCHCILCCNNKKPQQQYQHPGFQQKKFPLNQQEKFNLTPAILIEVNQKPNRLVCTSICNVNCIVSEPWLQLKLIFILYCQTCLPTSHRFWSSNPPLWKLGLGWPKKRIMCIHPHLEFWNYISFTTDVVSWVCEEYPETALRAAKLFSSYRVSCF